MSFESEENPVYTPFFGVMGATFAMIFSGIILLVDYVNVNYIVT